MTARTVVALVARNALACETARHPRCLCRCGGALHGVAHSPEWQAAQVAQIEQELADQAVRARDQEWDLFAGARR